jgi:hypothetical protein
VLCGSFCTFPSRIPAQQANHEHVTPSRIGRGCGPHISMIAASSAIFHCQGAPASLRLSAHCRRARDQQRTASASDQQTRAQIARTSASKHPAQWIRASNPSAAVRGGEKGTCPADASRKRFSDQLCTPPKPVFAQRAHHEQITPHRIPSHPNDRRRSCGPPQPASLTSLRLPAHWLCNRSEQIRAQVARPAASNTAGGGDRPGACAGPATSRSSQVCAGAVSPHLTNGASAVKWGSSVPS